MRSRWLVSILAALLIAGLSTSCTSSDEGSYAVAETAPPPTLETITWDETPLLSGISTTGVPVATAGSLIYIAEDYGDVVAIDLATGDEAWRRPSAGDVPGVSTNARLLPPIGVDGDLVLADYDDYECSDPCSPDDRAWARELGVAALSAADGSVTWTATLAPTVPSDDPAARYTTSLRVRRARVVDEVVMVSVALPDDSTLKPDGRPVRFTVGLDRATGAELWRIDNFELARWGAWGTIWAGPGRGKVPALLDPATGEVRQEFEGYVLMHAGDTGALMERNDESARLWVSSDGESIQEDSAITYSSEALGPGPLTVLIYREDRRIATLEADGSIKLSPPNDLIQLHGKSGDYLWANAPDSVRGNRQDAWIAIDRYGNQLSEAIEGDVIFLEGDRMLVKPYGEDTDYEIWSVTYS